MALMRMILDTELSSLNSRDMGLCMICSSSAALAPFIHLSICSHLDSLVVFLVGNEVW